MDQRDLVGRVRRGDQDAFAELTGAAVARLDAAARLILRTASSRATPSRIRWCKRGGSPDVPGAGLAGTWRTGFASHYFERVD